MTPGAAGDDSSHHGEQAVSAAASSRLIGVRTLSVEQSQLQDHLQLAASWRRDTPPPTIDPARLVLQLSSLRALSSVRRQVEAFLRASMTPGLEEDAVEDAVGKAVLVIDEMTSNALRHGRPPADLHLGDGPGTWTIVVTDAAPDQVPVPALDRPAGAGGYGLYVITDLTSRHGVHYEDDRKLVWATVTKP